MDHPYGQEIRNEQVDLWQLEFDWMSFQMLRTTVLVLANRHILVGQRKQEYLQQTETDLSVLSL